LGHSISQGDPQSTKLRCVAFQRLSCTLNPLRASPSHSFPAFCLSDVLQICLLSCFRSPAATHIATVAHHCNKRLFVIIAQLVHTQQSPGPCADLAWQALLPYPWSHYHHSMQTVRDNAANHVTVYAARLALRDRCCDESRKVHQY
jgi:hypothetical protein